MRNKQGLRATAIVTMAVGLTWVAIFFVRDVNPLPGSIPPGISSGEATSINSLNESGQPAPDRPAYGLLASPFMALECEDKKSRHYNAEACDAANASDASEAPDPVDSATLASVAEQALRGESFKLVGVILHLEYLGCSGSLRDAEGWDSEAATCHLLPMRAEALMLDELLRGRAQQGLPGSVEAYRDWLQTRFVVLMQTVHRLSALAQRHPSDERLKQDLKVLIAAETAARTLLEDWQGVSLR